MTILPWQPYIIAAIGAIVSPCVVEAVKRIHEDKQATETRENDLRTEITSLQRQLHDQEMDWRDRLDQKATECEDLRVKYYELLNSPRKKNKPTAQLPENAEVDSQDGTEDHER